MIRKILLCFIIVFVLLWLVGVHFIKGKLISLIEKTETDNINFTYQALSISGFPFSWRIKLSSPRITFVNQESSREISAENVTYTFDYSLKVADINWGKTLYYQNEHAENNKESYSFVSEKDMTINLKFKKSLYQVDFEELLPPIIKFVEFKNPEIIGLSENEEAFSVSEVNLYIVKDIAGNTENLAIKMAGNYKSLADFFKIKNANLLVNMSYHINNSVFANDSSIDFERMLEIKKGRLNFDGAFLDIQGDLKLKRSSMPAGQLLISMARYIYVIDTLIPEGFGISKSYINSLISKAINLETDNSKGQDVVNFKIQFSDNGISIGRVNLFETKIEE